MQIVAPIFLFPLAAKKGLIAFFFCKQKKYVYSKYTGHPTQRCSRGCRRRRRRRCRRRRRLPMAFLATPPKKIIIIKLPPPQGQKKPWPKSEALRRN